MEEEKPCTEQSENPVRSHLDRSLHSRPISAHKVKIISTEDSFFDKEKWADPISLTVFLLALCMIVFTVLYICDTLGYV